MIGYREFSLSTANTHDRQADNSMVAPHTQVRNAVSNVVQLPRARKAEQVKAWPAPQEPMKVAREFVARFEHRNPLRFIDGEWLGYNKRGFWASLSDRTIRDQIYKSLEHAVTNVDGAIEDWNPTARKVNDVVDALKTVASNSRRPNEHGWFDGRTDQVIPCANGLLNIKTRKLEPLTPQYFNRYVLTCDFDPSATSTAWERYRQENLNSDSETIAALEEWGGYIVSGRKDLQRYVGRCRVRSYSF
ncbi:hypothetical protein QWI29_01385 [Mycolicibacterium neoaurum]|uniref:hypothetical protein n=1 Tax=Mycolicibacterium neoaurum TaxID=1795 RepID=UPI00267322FA|nr:hypothetical protein [Mycolicibacterium neoaurum]MDO3398672.1 hypothetical protein [Mycolicibacterium neoaurum]